MSGQAVGQPPFDFRRPAVEGAKDQGVVTLNGLPRSPRGFCRLVFSPDGRQMAAIAMDEVQLYDRTTDRRFVLTSPVQLITVNEWLGNPTSLPSVVFSKDGKRLFSGNLNRVDVWVTSTGKLERTFEVMNGADLVRSVVVSGDSKRVATLKRVNRGYGRELTVWDAETGKELWSREFELGNRAVYAVQFTPDGSAVAVSAGGALRIYDAAGKAEPVELKDVDARQIFFHPTEPVWFVKLIPDTINVYRFRGPGQRPVALGNWLAKPYSLFQTLTADGKTFIVPNTEDKQIQFYDARTGVLKDRIGGHLLCAPAPDDQTMAVYAVEVGQILVYDLRTGKPTRSFPATAVNAFRNGGQLGLAVSPAADAVAWVAKDEPVRLEPLAGKAGVNRDVVLKLPDLGGKPMSASRLVVSPSGKYVAAMGGDTSASSIWDVQQQKMLFALSDPVSPNAPLIDAWTGVFPTDEKTFIAWGRVVIPQQRYNGHALVAYDLATQRARIVLLKVAAIASAADGSASLITASTLDSDLWDITHIDWANGGKSKAAVKNLNIFNLPAPRALTPDGKATVIAHQANQPGADLRFDYWNPATGEFRPASGNKGDRPGRLQFYNRGKLVVAMTEGQMNYLRKLPVFDVESGSLNHELKDIHAVHSGAMAGFCFSPADTGFVSFGTNGEVFLRDHTTGKVIGRFDGHKGTITDAAFFPDGQRLATASDDQTVRIWTVSKPQR